MMNQEKLRELTKHYHSTTPEDVVGVTIAKKEVNGKLTNEDSVVFTIRKKKPLSEIPEEDRLPEEIEVDGSILRTDVVEGEFVFLENCPSDFYTWQNTPPSNRNTIRPLKGGISVTNFTRLGSYVGTLGFLAVDTENNSLVGVSNNHVLVKDAFIASERSSSSVKTSIHENYVTQPNESGNSGLQNSIGFVKKYVPLSGTPQYNKVDCALTTINNNQMDSSLSYQQHGMVGWTQPLEFATTSEIDSIIGPNKKNLFSSGRTTGPKGEGDMKLFADSVTTSISIDYNKQGTEQTIYFSDCIRFYASATTTPSGNICPYPINGGDSGSALVADFSGTRKIVGLVFAGQKSNGQTIYGFANRIDKVAEQMSISAWTGNNVYFSSTGSTQLHKVSGLSSDINLTLSGNTYWQAGIS